MQSVVTWHSLMLCPEDRQSPLNDDSSTLYPGINIMLYLLREGMVKDLRGHWIDAARPLLLTCGCSLLPVPAPCTL